MSRRRDVEDLIRRGFDLSIRSGKYVYPRCSQCQPVMVQRTATHKEGCPNEMHECTGCMEPVRRGVQLCADCILLGR